MGVLSEFEGYFFLLVVFLFALSIGVRIAFQLFPTSLPSVARIVTTFIDICISVIVLHYLTVNLPHYRYVVGTIAGGVVITMLIMISAYVRANKISVSIRNKRPQ